MIDKGFVVVFVVVIEESQFLVLFWGLWKWLRIIVASVAGIFRFGVVGIREVVLLGFTTTRTVVTFFKLFVGSAPLVVAFRAQELIEFCVQLCV